MLVWNSVLGYTPYSGYRFCFITNSNFGEVMWWVSTLFYCIYSLSSDYPQNASKKHKQRRSKPSIHCCLSFPVRFFIQIETKAYYRYHILATSPRMSQESKEHDNDNRSLLTASSDITDSGGVSTGDQGGMLFIQFTSLLQNLL